jgi:predicted house-cleaning noncanonical NTP pyrophosphatase (MazG superfamily)
MSTTNHNKLVRDKVPDRITAEGGAPKTHILDKAAYLQALIELLFEEAEVFAENQTIDELAELQEILLALTDALNITPGDLAKAYLAKANAEGAFKKRIFLESVEAKT